MLLFLQFFIGLNFNSNFLVKKINLRLNSLLLADEFRSKVLEDALKINSQTPDDFEWSPLQYVTLNDDLTQKSIRNLDQLRKMNKQEKENEVPMECENIEENVNETAASGIVGKLKYLKSVIVKNLITKVLI